MGHAFAARTLSLRNVEGNQGIAPGPAASGEEDEEQEEGEVLAEEGEPALEEPSKYAAVLHNDDYTTMDFVVEVLKAYFAKSTEEAVRVMLQVHQAGRGVAGVYSHEIAETKASQVMEAARARGFPLRCTVEKA